MRAFLMIVLLSLAACSREAPPEVRAVPPGEHLPSNSAPAEAAWCAPALCTTCGLDATFYETTCPEMTMWCAADAPCPGNLEPLFCSGDPLWSECVFIGLAVCGELNSTWCCTADHKPLGPIWSCKKAEDCPPAPDCLERECWEGKCSYDLAPAGAVCDDAGGTHCEFGICVP